MMIQSFRSGVVVGTDGSPSSARAIEWAAREARRREAALTICHVTDWRALIDAPLTPDVVRLVRSQTDALLEQGAASATETAPGLQVETRSIDGNIAEQLLAAGRSADVLVLGFRGRGGFAALLLGSVTAQVTTHSTGPVVVVRTGGVPADRVVVGVDGSHHADRAVGFAFEHASRTGLPLHAVHAYHDPLQRHGLGHASLDRAGLTRKAAEDVLAAAIGPWTEKYPQVAVEEEVITGHPATVLREASRKASLLVVGSRGHGEFVGAALGSVGYASIRHAFCPVAVVR